MAVTIQLTLGQLLNEPFTEEEVAADVEQAIREVRAACRAACGC